MRKLLCFLFGHKYYYVKRLSYTSRKISCGRCNKMFVMNDDARAILPWDDDFEKIYKMLEEFNNDY